MKKLKELVGDALPDEGRNALPALKSPDITRERRNGVLIGNSGTGMTHLAIISSILSCDQNFSVSFRTVPRPIDEIFEARRGTCLSNLILPYKKD